MMSATNNRELLVEKALEKMKLYPEWLKQRPFFIEHHQARAVWLCENLAAALRTLCKEPGKRTIKSVKLPVISFLLESTTPNQDNDLQIATNPLEEYEKILATIDNEELKKRFDSPGHMLLDLHILGSVFAGLPTGELQAFIKCYYMLQKIPHELFVLTGVSPSLLNSTEFQESLKQRTNYYFECNDSSIKDAVDRALESVPKTFVYSWTRAADAQRRVYFLRYDNRNTLLAELKGLDPSVLLVLGFMKKTSGADQAQIEKEARKIVSTVVNIEISNDDTQQTSVLRVHDIAPLLKVFEKDCNQ